MATQRLWDLFAGAVAFAAGAAILIAFLYFVGYHVSRLVGL